jgi:hypothetical protein
MASGRVVVGNVAADVRAFVPDEIPVFDAPANAFEERMRELIGDPATQERLAAAGPAYARTWHDGRKAASVIGAFLEGTLAASTSGASSALTPSSPELRNA